MKKILMIFSCFLLFFACVKKTGTEPQDLSEKDGDTSAEPVETYKVVLGTAGTPVADQPAVGYVNYIVGYQDLNTSSGNASYPNGNFDKWVDLCWLWGQYLNGPKASIIADSPSEFEQLFGISMNGNWRTYCEPQAVSDNFKAVTGQRTYLAKKKSVRLVPENHLSARYAQMWLDRDPNTGVKSGFYFNGATFNFGTQESNQDLGLIEPINGGGVKLKNVRANNSLPVVNGQMTTGVPRALRGAATSGFIETVRLAEGLGNHPFTSKPRAIEVELAYFPKDNDKAIVEIMLHGPQDGVRLPFKTPEMTPPHVTVGSNALAYMSLIIDKQIDRTKIQVPIRYKDQNVTPAYLLSNFSAGFEYIPVQGSVLEVYSVKFIYD